MDEKDFSVEVRFLWEGAASSSDDDVGGVVCRLHTSFQGFVLDELRQETYGQIKEESFSNREQGNAKIYQGRHTGRILPPTKASPAPFVSTMSLESIFSTGNVSILSSDHKDKSQTCGTEVTKNILK